MDNLGFNDQTQNQIFRVLALILHLGNVTFDKAGEDASAIKNRTGLTNAAQLMEVDVGILEKGLITRVQVTRGETFVTPLNANQVLFSCVVNCLGC